ncbi:nicotinate-nucleotide dimethylbenzimidazole-P phosphoribosyl transferase [Nitrospira sp. KM1]|uniref:nicotinate-nucleotide--dimethylbenzimidazole phosphoribosyltransferase n=1 Tax=Nitrospira sp. KM1 TaxID=1936990 RepID=UPI0013A77A54|nr:nicotinate-nucleotide--dimethylbenzimidazole phosphoribosyltransferase [Nitrospira sp. KM1]BCA53644.1 nicotinate-nucleotide dimethylbenzimidazole-P phosphoribosyl transferase [Nitrospira sp. KM1]
MSLLDVTRMIGFPDMTAAADAQRRLDNLTKPQGSLGRLEELAVQYCAMTGDRKPAVPSGVVFTFAADHGVVDEGVSAYPRAVTAQMVLNFIRSGAAVNVLARHVGIPVRVVDIGVDHEFPTTDGLINRKLMRGTCNMLREAAMSRPVAEQAIMVGVELATAAVRDGAGLIGTGEMGIGNTTASSAITAAMTGAAVDSVTGAGTGIDERAREKKVKVIGRALAIHQPDSEDPLDVLAKVGGLEIAGMAGLILGGAAVKVPVVLDGFIAGAAALIACGVAPRCREFLIASHRSVERGHRIILERLRLNPLFDLDLRLGEGTGACLGIGMVQAAVKILTEMATFGEAGVSGRSE